MRYYVSNQDVQEILGFLMDEKKIPAIKYCRKVTGVGLREAKLFVEHLSWVVLECEQEVDWPFITSAPTHSIHLLKWSKEDLATQLLLVAEMSVYLKETGQLTEETEDES